jgi:hypothetical protein
MTTATALRDVIRSRSNGRKQATVEGLWQVLEEMERKGIKTFTIAQVGRHAEAAGVLRTQTLRNASGEDYRALIDAFARDIGVPTTSLPSTKATPLEEAIESIPDLDVRTRLKMVLVENLRQREEIARLRQGFKHIQQMNQVGVPSLEVLPPPIQQVDIVPLEKFLSPAWIEERRWTVEPNGTLYDETGECIAPVGFIISLAALVHPHSREK